MLFLAPEDYACYHETLHETFRRRPCASFLGYPTNFAGRPRGQRPRLLQATDSGPVEHRVETYTVEGYGRDYLGISLNDALRRPVGSRSRSNGSVRSRASGLS